MMIFARSQKKCEYMPDDRFLSIFLHASHYSLRSHRRHPLFDIWQRNKSFRDNGSWPPNYANKNPMNFEIKKYLWSFAANVSLEINAQYVFWIPSELNAICIMKFFSSLVVYLTSFHLESAKSKLFIFYTFSTRSSRRKVHSIWLISLILNNIHRITQRFCSTCVCWHSFGMFSTLSLTIIIITRIIVRTLLYCLSKFI